MLDVILPEGPGTKKQKLVKLYYSIFGTMPKSSMRAGDIERVIRRYYAGIQRAKELKP